MYRQVRPWKNTFYLIILLSLLSCGVSQAQVLSIGEGGPGQLDQLLAGKFELLPLSTVADSARFHSPALKNAELDLRSQELALRDAKLAILKALSFNGNYNYGTNARFNSSESSSSDINNSLSITENANYSVGISIKLSLYDILSRKNTLNRSNLEIQKFKHDREILLQALDELVVTAYQDCLLKKKLMDLFASDRVSADLNLQMARKQFQSGEITVAQVTDMIDAHSKSIISFESAKADLQISLFKLSQLSGIRIEDLIIDVN